MKLVVDSVGQGNLLDLRFQKVIEGLYAFVSRASGLNEGTPQKSSQHSELQADVARD